MKASDFPATDAALTWWLETAFASDADTNPWSARPLSRVAPSAIVARAQRNFFIETPFLVL